MTIITVVLRLILIEHDIFAIIVNTMWEWVRIKIDELVDGDIDEFVIDIWLVFD